MNARTIALSLSTFCVLMIAAWTPAANVIARGEAAMQDAQESKKSDSDDAKKPAPSKEKPFAEVVKDAQVIEGLFTLYRTEEKVYLEIAPEQLDKTYLVSLTCDSSIGERGFYAAQMCGDTPVVFHKQNKNVQLLAKSVRFVAAQGTPAARSVARSFSDSILGTTKIESLPHPERKSVLIDLGALLLTDVPLLSYELEAVFRIPYRFDAKNSSFGMLKALDRNVEI